MRYIKLIVLSTVFSLSYGDIYKADTCNTPDGKDGECIHINKCRSLWPRAYQLELSNNFDFLRRSQCGNGQYMYCCPLKPKVECYTPDGRPGNCILYSTYIFQHEDTKFLMDSKCDTSELKFCYSALPRKVSNSNNCSQNDLVPDQNSNCCGIDASDANRIIDNQKLFKDPEHGTWSVIIPSKPTTPKTDTEPEESSKHNMQETKNKLKILIKKLNACQDRNTISENLLRSYEELKLSNQALKIEHQRALMKIKSLENKTIATTEKHRHSSSLLIGPIIYQRNEDLYNIISQIHATLGVSIPPQYIQRDNINVRYLVVNYKDSNESNFVLHKFHLFRKNGGKNTYGGILYHIKKFIPPKTRLLSRDAMVLKDYGYKYIWVANDRVYVRKTDSSPVFLIKSKEQINKILRADVRFIK